ncbi:hypothetical protein HHI36_012024 [Cryptolaemus montrouzieri]|uniref:Uncharacterized protein n=1 Tax=Cryptolaemus montrouzieri TaxID=559131 RepID=A0ABD2NDQ6_9CUCU
MYGIRKFQEVDNNSFNLLMPKFHFYENFICHKNSTERFTYKMEQEEKDDPSLKGLSKIFNGRTIKGRAHVAMATYAVIGGLILYFMTKPARPPPEKSKEQPKDCIKFNTYNLPPTKI